MRQCLELADFRGVWISLPLAKPVMCECGEPRALVVEADRFAAEFHRSLSDCGEVDMGGDVPIAGIRERFISSAVI